MSDPAFCLPDVALPVPADPGSNPPMLRTILATFVTATGLAACQAPGPLPPTSAASPTEPLAQVYRQIDGRPLAAHVFTPREPAAGKRAAILVFHGGGWVSGNAQWGFKTASRFADLGLVAVSIEYRLAKPDVSPVEQLSDACEAFRWARANASTLGVDASRVAGYGISAGGQLVAAAAAIGCDSPEGAFRNGGPDAMVLLSPSVDLASDRFFTRLMAGHGDPAAYSPLHRIRRRVASALVIQGELDTVTPLAGAQAFCSQVRAHGGMCVLHSYPGLGHLLTRNVAGSQITNIDPDPAAVAASQRAEADFIRSAWPGAD